MINVGSINDQAFSENFVINLLGWILVGFTIGLMIVGLIGLVVAVWVVVTEWLKPAEGVEDLDEEEEAQRDA